MIRAAMFDLDGVLFDTAGLVEEARRSVEGRDPGGTRVRAAYGRLLRQRRHFRDPESANVLRALADRGVLLAVVTDSPSAWASRLLWGAGCRSLFTCVIGAEAVCRPKPDPSGICLALRSLRVPADEAVYVGHTADDELAARRAKVRYLSAAWAVPSSSSDGEVLAGMRDLLSIGRNATKNDEPLVDPLCCPPPQVSSP